MNLSLKNLSFMVAIVLSVTLSSQGTAVESQLWQQFKQAKKSGTEPILPDFSYAGYKYSEQSLPDTSNWQIFNVSDYGAVPDDGIHDDEGIQAAIDAAEAYTANIDPSNTNNGAIVKFASGRYEILPNQGLLPEQAITIEGNNILLKGTGNSSSGTVIFIKKHMAPVDYCAGENCYGIPSIKFTPASTTSLIRSNITENFERETFELTVEDGSKFFVDQHVRVWLSGSTKLLNDQLNGKQLLPDYTATIDNGMTVREIHTIKAIKGNKITLYAPVHITLKSTYGAQLRSVDVLENVGMEKIQILGNWKQYVSERNEPFVHHNPNDTVDDYGWTGVALNTVINGWVDRVEFKDLNISLKVQDSAAVTVSNTTFTGEKGHASINITESYGVLGKDLTDTAGHHHGYGIAQRNSGGVYLRSVMQYDQRADFHAAGPYASLHDSMKGGHMSKNGGNIIAHPHHLNHYVSWNFEVHGGITSYDFWPSRRNGETFLNPFFIGLHGDSVTLKDSTVAVNESQGAKVEPDSLFEAQLGLRLLPGYTYCCTEGETKFFEKPVDIAFGTSGQYNYIYGIQGSVTFNTISFGDPNLGQKKVVYYREPLALTLIKDDEFLINVSDRFNASLSNLIYSTKNLPAGLIINSSNAFISGQPSVSGQYLVPIQAKEQGDNGHTFTTYLNINVISAPKLTDVSSDIANYVQGDNLDIMLSDYFQAIDDQSLSYSSSDLPTGLSVTTLGKISGKLINVGTYTFNVTAKASNDLTVKRTFTITSTKAQSGADSNTNVDNTVKSSGGSSTQYLLIVLVVFSFYRRNYN